MEVLIFLFIAVLAALGVGAGLIAARSASRPRPALPENCGDCVFMVPRAKVYKRETLEEADGLVHYMCQKRWIEVTPVSPWCDLGKSKTRVIR